MLEISTLNKYIIFVKNNSLITQLNSNLLLRWHICVHLTFSFQLKADRLTPVNSSCNNYQPVSKLQKSRRSGGGGGVKYPKNSQKFNQVRLSSIF